MYKLIAVLFFTVALTKSQSQNITTLGNIYQTNPPVTRTDDYINANRQQYAKNIQEYELIMEKFRQIYAGRTDVMSDIGDMLVSSLVQNDERLNPLELLSDFSKECVTKYRSSIPTTAATKTSISSCITTATNQVNSMLNSPLSTKNTLQNYYTTYFEKEVTNCAKKFDSATSNYTICVTSVTSTTNTYTISNQKTFDTQMDSAYCTSNANIKKALDCTFLTQNRTISLIAEANTLINKCLLGQDDCRKCNQGFTCSNAYYMDYADVDYKNETMPNPFYRSEFVKDCLMLVLQ